MNVIAELALVAAVTRTRASDRVAVTVNVARFWWKTNEDLVQLMPMVFTGSVVVGDGLELLFIKAMCIIEYIYIYTYITSFIMLLSCVRRRVLVFLAV